VPKGPILNYKNPALRRVVLAQLEQIAQKERAVFIKIDPGVIKGWGSDGERKSPVGAKFIEELKARDWRYSNDQIQFRNTVELDLDRSEDDILASMKQKTRYNIRLAARKGVVVRMGSPDDFTSIARMYVETAARDDFTVRPVEYYLDVWQTLFDAKMAQPLIAEYQNEQLSAVIVVKYGPRALYMYGASTGHERQRMPNHLLQWQAILWAKENGCNIYDFWGAPDEFDESDPLWGVWRFKAGFNGQVVRHIGAWDYPARPFWYWIYTAAIPKYLAFLRSRNR
jgi:lipid II:glycine glycyltransferase (peptidoglycan interpeptide bridge formation enzyme)